MIPDRRGVIDIGSNAIRFVAYGGASRAPIPQYNEKCPVSLGASVAETGRIADEPMMAAIAGLSRFVRLAALMKLPKLRIVATAAVRDATNGGDLIRHAAALGIKIDLLTGDEEALAAGMGVLCDAPWANGYVGDLGGGSLEIVRISGGKLGDRVSLPLGTLRLKALNGKEAVAEALSAQLEKHSRFHVDPGLDFYLVGGAWRALMRLAQHVADYPLDILANYAITPGILPKLVDMTRDLDVLRALKILPAPRIPSLHDAARLVTALTDTFRPVRLIASAGGIREGLLIDALTKAQRAEDPLIACTRFEGLKRSRFGLSGDAFDDWMAPMFADDDPDAMRLRNAACHLADCAWSVHPEHRAEHARALAIEGNWIGIDGPSRAIMSRALFAAYGGAAEDRHPVEALATPQALARAHQWGLAIRLAMRIDAGTGRSLASAPVSIAGDLLRLQLKGKAARLDADTVRRRLRNLAGALGLKAVLDGAAA